MKKTTHLFAAGSALIPSLAIAMSLAALVPAFGQPVIRMQPHSQSVSLGANVTFNVSIADGVEPLNYQWRRNETALAGETKSTLTLTNVQAAHVGSYRVVVVDGFGESMTSEAAVLTVDPTFTKITVGQVVTDLAEFWSAAWGDYDNDGFIDLLLGTQLLALLSALTAEFSIDTNRISVTGLSMGGYGVWSLLQRYPTFFAAAVPICGGGNPALAASFRDVPVWNFHAANDNIVPVDGSRSMISALRQAGGRPLYTEYARGGHESWTGAYRNPYVVEWTFAQRRGEPSHVDPSVAFLSPTEQDSVTTGAAAFDLSGAASAYGESITQVKWTSTLTRAPALARGTTTWIADGIPLQRGKNRIVVTATTTSWSDELGGVTTFNRTFEVQQAAPIYATITRSKTNLVLDWIGGAPPFRVERLNAVAGGGWMEMLNNAVAPVTLPNETQAAFHRIAGR